MSTENQSNPNPELVITDHSKGSDKVEVKKTEPKADKPKEPAKPEPKLSDEERILNFLEGKNDFVKINDFLKSLFPLPKVNEPAVYLQQGVSKTLKNQLEQMVAKKQIQIQSNSHQKLGTFFYEGNDPRTQYYNITNLNILAKI